MSMRLATGHLCQQKCYQQGRKIIQEGLFKRQQSTLDANRFNEGLFLWKLGNSTFLRMCFRAISAFLGASRTHTSSESIVREARFHRIEDYACWHLSDSELKPNVITLVCNISTSYSHSLFEECR